MRTRSQQASPGGFISLDDDRAPRRTRSTRSNTNQDTATPAQPAARAKPQRTAKKTAATTKKPTTKSQTRKTSTTKRATRQSTRQAGNTTSDDDAHPTIKDDDITRNISAAQKTTPEKEPEIIASENKSKSASFEAENGSSESYPCESFYYKDPFPPKDPKDRNHHDALDSQGIRAASCLQEFIDTLSVCSPLTERSRTPSLASVDKTEAVLAPRTAQESGAIPSETSKTTDKHVSKVSAPTPAAEEREPPAEPTVAEPMGATLSTSSEQSTTASLASAAGSGGVAVVEDGLVGALVTAFAGLSLDDLAPRPPDEATGTLMESTTAPIGEPVEPTRIAPPNLPASQQQWVREWAQQVPSTGYLHPITGQLVGGPSASVELAGEPTSNSGSPTRQDGVRDYYLRKRRREVQVLSPLQEDQESQSSPGPGSGVPNVVSLGSPGNRPSTPNRNKLTPKPETRKRARSDTSDEERNNPQTPAANKRRNLGPPGSTPYRPASRPRALTANITPYSERRRRRAVEKDGRIHSTAIRVSQLLAQQEADRRRQAAESSAPLSSFPGLPQTNFEFSVDKAYDFSQSQGEGQSLSDQSSTPQQPVTPERTRGWNIRGLLNSVPRRFSRIIPTFGRSPERNQEPVPLQPSSERASRTQAPEPDSSASQNQTQSNRGSSEEPPQKRARKSWSLFPQPFDRSLYLGDLSKKKSTTPSSAPLYRPADKPLAEESKSRKSTASDGQANADQARELVQVSETEESAQKKRKRSLSPDVIPNPPGCSYGLDLDYFCYSSESEEEQELPQSRTEQKKPDHSAKAAVRSALRSERPSSKKVRFDASPENTPSKLRLRARATDPYHGRHFIGMGNDSDTAAPESPPPVSHVSDESPSRAGFVPNLQGTFQLDYDAFSDDSESSGFSSANAPAPSPLPSSPNVARVDISESLQSPDLRPAPRQVATAPSTPAKIDEEALARARSQAEKYKPKTPSGLRTASRYSSPMTATPDTVSASAPVATPTPASAAEPAPELEQQPTEDFGDDEFAREAQWLYENCPSGDLGDLVWPQPVTYEEQDFSPEAVTLVNEAWDPAMIDFAYANIWTPGLEAFKRELELGMSEVAQA
ncbi:hypothetical protein BO94DRAFT_471049 [Aspergillus sclerotioniger CBS 115572]|uniref:Uncharacterized protein n=1 Tax=Aspergillus sclerotioniger CBS 115572 TaxID=1450535 RepID=A0A317W4Y4_9EURO|nr:hypothetical protein BO94DRAFT_471049 [Aspergillus sclerotioniger CBS 115572]PWY80372.1 hypothetical protein BO94DRAFT_471049 [Aspergillus sclerotioniger CBS 115572]